MTEQTRSATASNNADDIVTGVKDAVAREVSSLSPDAKVVRTNYFSHNPGDLFRYRLPPRRDFHRAT